MGGRHVDPDSSRFVRDLVVMLVGIALVALLVFGGLWMVARLGADDDASAATPPTTVATSATSDTTTTTTAPSTTPTSEPTTTAPSTTTTTVEVREPSEVSVQVFNAEGTPGLAGSVTQELAGLGYVTLTALDYPEFLEVSRIFYREGFGPEAMQLAVQFPDAEIEPMPADLDTAADLALVLGASHQG